MIAQKYDGMWKKVSEMRSKDLPASAAKEAHNIYTLAVKNNNNGQMLAAVLTEMQLKADISPDSTNAYVARFEKMLGTEEREPVQALLHLVLGDLYSLQNRNLEDSAQAKAVKHLERCMANSEMLAAENALNYIPFIIKGTDSRYFHNDLLSVVAKTAGTCLRDMYNEKLGSDTLMCETFNKEISVYRKLGWREAEFLALMDSIDICENRPVRPFRKVAVRNVETSGDEPLDRKAVYKSLIKRFGDLNVCVEAYIRLASDASSKTCWHWAQEGIKRYPDTKRTEVLRNRLKQLSAPQLSAALSGTCYPGRKDTVRIAATNLSACTVHFYRFPFAASSNEPRQMDQKTLERYAVNAVLEIPVKLRKGEPYEEIKDSISFTVPQAGRYLVQVTSDKVKSEIHEYSVSALRLLMFSLPENKARAWVTDAESGKPIENAFLDQVLSNGPYKLEKTYKTNADGVVILSPINEQRLYFARIDEDNALEGVQIYSGGNNFDEPSESSSRLLALFSDRAIYRPGQQVHVGGFLYRKQGDAVQVMPDAEVKLQLFDANYKKVGDERTVQADKWGALNCDFMLPATCLNGFFRVNSQYGNLSFRVEAYKRPTFTVTFEDVKEAYKAGDTVKIKGTVKTYAGFPVSDTKVGVKVSREFSPWCFFFNEESSTLMLDTLVTDAEGHFTVPVSIKFPKKQDRDLYHSRFFLFRTTATVTTDDGETEEGESTLFAGDHPVFLSSDIPERLCKEQQKALCIIQRNAACQLVEGKGFYEISREGKTVLKGEMAFNVPFDGKTLYALPSGQYTLNVVPEGIGDTTVRLRQTFVLFSLNDSKPYGKEKLQVYASASTFETGKPVKVMVASPLRDAYVFCDRYEGCRLADSKLVRLSDKTFTESLLYKEAYGNGVQLHYVLVRDGKVYENKVEILKPEPDKKLKLRWSVFRDRLRPGQKEEWRLQVLRGDKPVAASLIATLYDASLDKFAKLSWDFALRFDRPLPWLQMQTSGERNLNLYLQYPVK